jgi:hypothetical protein
MGMTTRTGMKAPSGEIIRVTNRRRVDRLAAIAPFERFFADFLPRG